MSDSERLAVDLDASNFIAGANAAATAAAKTDSATDALKKRLGELLRESQALKAAFIAGAAQDEQYAESKARIGKELSEVQRQLRAASAAAKDNTAATAQVGAAQEDAGKKAKKGGTDLEESGKKTKAGAGSAAQALLQLGRGVQDFSAAGIGGITNNIEGLAASLGLGAGIAGVATVAGVAIQLLGPTIMQFLGSLNKQPVVDFRSEIDRLTARIKELEDKPLKSVVDIDELARAKREVKELTDGLQAFYALQEKRTVEERKAGSKLDEQLTAALGGGEGFKRIEDAVIDQRVAARIAANPDIKRLREEQRSAEERAKLIGDAHPAARSELVRQAAQHKAEAEALEGTITNNARSEVGDSFSKAFAGRDADRERLARVLDEAGRGDLATLTRSISAASIKAEEIAKVLEKQRETAEKALGDLAGGARRGFDQAVNEQMQRNARIQRNREERERQAEAERRQGTAQSRQEVGAIGRENERVASQTLESIGPQLRQRIVEGRQAGVGRDDLERALARQVEDFLRKAGYNDPLRAGGIAYDVVGQGFNQVDDQAFGAAGANARIGGVPMGPDALLRAQLARAGRRGPQARRPRGPAGQAASREERLAELQRQLGLEGRPDRQVAIQRQIAALGAVGEFEGQEAQARPAAAAKAQSSIQRERQASDERAAAVQAEIIQNQAKTAALLNAHNGNLRNAQAVGQQLNQAGRTAQKRGGY